MKILWVTNIPISPMQKMLGNKSINTSGTWLDTSYNLLKNQKNIELVIVTISNIKKILYQKDDNSSMYILPSGGNILNYNSESIVNKKNWESIKNKENPDIIQIWGTEFSHGLLAARVFFDKPIIVYMQGMMSQISKHYFSSLTNHEIKNSITLRDFVKKDTIKHQKNKFEKRAECENKLLKLAQYIIVENQWCSINCKIINPKAQIIYSKLPINNEFYNYNWDAENFEINSIMTVAGGYPIKGFHVLLKALSIVKKEIEHFKLYVPGHQLFIRKGFVDKLKINGYENLLEKMIVKYNLKDNIVFMGNLSQKEMAHRISISNIFVMPSSIENHSSSLIEAMIVGLPCVASSVGGVPELIQNNVNGYLYRFEEYEILAYYILDLLKNKEKSKMIASEAKKIRESRINFEIEKDLEKIYFNILENKNNIIS